MVSLAQLALRSLKYGAASQIISSTPAASAVALFSIAGRTGATGPRPRTMPTTPISCTSTVQVSAQVRITTISPSALPSAAWLAREVQRLRNNPNGAPQPRLVGVNMDYDVNLFIYLILI